MVSAVTITNVHYGEINVVLIKKTDSVFYPLRLLQLLVELVEGLAVFLPHLNQQLFVNFGLVVQTPFEMRHLGLALGPEKGEWSLILCQDG